MAHAQARDPLRSTVRENARADEAALDMARDLLQGHALEASAGATSPDAQVVVLRVLTPVVEPAMDLLKLVWRAWRKALWQLEAPNPRIWSA